LRVSNTGQTSKAVFSSISDTSAVKSSDGGKLCFSSVVEADRSANQQSEIHNKLKPLIAALFNGKNSIIFSLGASCSGKSFCIQGTKDYPGLLPRAVEYLFGLADKYIWANAETKVTLESAAQSQK
jgi:kinesin family member 20